MADANWIRPFTLALIIGAGLLFGAAQGTGRSSTKGTLFLVAKPELIDPMFRESVVVMLPQSRIPLVVGLIVNRPTKVRLRELFPDSSALKNRADTAYLGGPVDISEPTIVFRQARASADAIPLFDGVYASLDAKSLAGMMKAPGKAQDLRLYLGRSQWSPDQLHAEMQEGSWYVVPADPAFVFSADPKSVWQTLLGRAQAIPAAAQDIQTPGYLRRLLFVEGLQDCPPVRGTTGGP